MPEAVIVATARSPIGRAGQGALTQIRPDDLAVQMVRAALAKIPALDVRKIDDLMLGCASPAGESGFNLQWHDKQLGIKSMCVGGGQGMAMVLERLA